MAKGQPQLTFRFERTANTRGYPDILDLRYYSEFSGYKLSGIDGPVSEEIERFTGLEVTLRAGILFTLPDGHITIYDIVDQRSGLREGCLQRGTAETASKGSFEIDDDDWDRYRRMIQGDSILKQVTLKQKRPSQETYQDATPSVWPYVTIHRDDGQDSFVAVKPECRDVRLSTALILNTGLTGEAEVISTKAPSFRSGHSQERSILSTIPLRLLGVWSMF